MHEYELPHSTEAEQAILGGVLKDSRCLDSVIEFVQSPDIFYHPKHKIIFDAILRLFEKSEAQDITTIADELTKSGNLDEIGGRLYLIDLVDGIATTANVAAYARIVVEKYKTRKLIEIMEKLKSEAYNGEPSDVILSNIDVRLADLYDNDGDDFEPLGVIANNFLTELLDKKVDRTGMFLPTRIQDLDDAIIGLFKKDMIIIAGPPSMGKSSLALDIGVFNSAKENKTLYFSLDERKTALVQRIISSATSVEPKKLYRPQTLSELEESMLTRAGLDMAKAGHIYISEKTNINVYDIKSTIAKRKRQHGVDCVIIDYIQQLKPIRKYERKDLEVGDNSRLLKAIAKKLDVAMIVVSQLSREYAHLNIDIEKGQYGIPTPSMLRESGSLEQDANLILFVWNVMEALRKRGLGTDSLQMQRAMAKFKIDDDQERSFIVIAKNKIGETKSIECIWNKRRMRFYSESRRLDYEL